jgi:chemotaxis protein methyltransferase CheR
MQKSFMEIFNNILGSIREPLLMLDSDLKFVRANHSF